MLIIDRFAYNSRIADVKVSEKLLFAGLPLLICLFASSIITDTLIIIILSAATIYWGSIRMGQYMKLLAIPLGFLLIGVVTIMVSSIGTENTDTIFSFTAANKRFGVTFSGLNQSMIIIFRSLASICCFYFIALNTPMNSMFGFLQRLNRSPLLVDLMELIYRFVFMIWDEVHRMYIAQSARLGYKNFTTSMKSMAELVSILFINCLNRVERIHMSLESRGFNGNFSYLVSDAASAKSIKLQAVILNLFLLMTVVFERIIR